MADISKITPLGSSTTYDITARALNYSPQITTLEELNAFGKNEIKFKVAKISALDGHTGTLTKNDGMILAFPWSGGYGHQFYVDDNGYGLHHRYWYTHKVNDVDTVDFNNWVQIIDSNNYTNYTVKKDGTGASGSWNISITGNAATATTATTANAVAWSNVTSKPIELGAYNGALNTNGWKTLGARTSGAKIYIAYNNNAATWNSSTYSASMVFGCNDTKGLLDCGYNTPVVTFGGSSNANSTDNAPNWYFKLSGTSGATYTFPTSSKTLVATDGTGASGNWGISISGKAATAGVADSANAVAWGNVTGKPDTFSPSAHTHYELATIGDQRSTATTPNTYANRLIFQGLKTNTQISSPSNDVYSYIVGLRGWADSSGGNSHELAFNNTGFYHRSGATTSWNDWEIVGNIKWNAVTQGQKWSRICLITPKSTTEGSSGILSISCTRSSVVVNTTFIITTAHAGSKLVQINQLGGSNYSSVKIRGVCSSNGTSYIELYDTANSIASGTTQTWHCSYKPLLNSQIIVYTAFTDGTTIPSGYTAYNELTTFIGDNSSAIVNISRDNTTFTATRQNGSTFTFTQQDNNTATAADNILDGSNSGTQITYAPYSSQQSKLSFDTSATNPSRNDRLNLNGYLYATKLYSGGNEVLTSHQSLSGYIPKSTLSGAYDIMYSSAANTPTRLAANTTTTKKFLRMTGTGSAGAAPAWDTVTKSDVGLGNVTNDAQIPKSIGTTKGDIIYWSAANTPARLAIGSTGKVLKVANGIPSWGDITIPYGETLPSTGNAGDVFLQTSAEYYELPTGGSTGRLLMKRSTTDRDVQWTNNVYVSNDVLFGAAWNDYAEYRECLPNEFPKAGNCVIETGEDSLRLSTQRMQPGAEIVSDTFGFAIGKTNKATLPIAVSGRVLAYTYENREEFKKNIGKPVCSGPNGTVSIMTDEEYRNYGYCAIGTISSVPSYETWGENNIKVDNRVWIKVR